MMQRSGLCLRRASLFLSSSMRAGVEDDARSSVCVTIDDGIVQCFAAERANGVCFCILRSKNKHHAAALGRRECVGTA